MRYLILFFAFLSPITLLAQSEGTIEFSVTTSQMKMEFDTVMANLPEGMQLDSAMAAQAAQVFESMQNEQVTATMLLHYSGAKALVETAMPDRRNPVPNVSPFGSFDSNTGMTQFYDFEERVIIMKMPDTGESVPYVVSHEFQAIDFIDWMLVDVDSTILGHAVKKAEFISDSLQAVVWYAPGIASTAGPHQFGNLPGLPFSIDAVMSHVISAKISFVAKSLKEVAEKPVTPPVGIVVTQEEYMKIMMEKFSEGDQFVP